MGDIKPMSKGDAYETIVRKMLIVPQTQHVEMKDLTI